jgi:hypothetical protein
MLFLFLFLWMVSAHALLPNGFFGMIGPNVKKETASSLYQLFTSNGILQGVFIQDTTLTSVSHLIQTERVLFETRHGRSISSNIYHLPLQMFLSQFHLFPHMGTANTAVLSVQEHDYVLFERDLPYRIRIDSERKTVSTQFKIKSPCHAVSAHSWYHEHVYSHSYSILHQTVSFMTMNETFYPLQVDTFRTRYVPLIHSHLRVRQHYVFTDSPLFFSWKQFFKGKFPFEVQQKPTFIHITPDMYTSKETFFIFHYASLHETSDAFILYAPLYESLDFSTTELYGKYRKLILHKCNKTISIEKNNHLEKYNLDFPILWNHYTLLRNLNLATQKIDGFILCDGLTIYKEFWISLDILGEPCIENDSILFFAFNQTGTFFVHVHILSGIQKEYAVNISGTLGFHSFFKK